MLRLAVSAAGLTYLVTRFHPGRVLPPWHTRTLAWAIGGTVVTFVAVVPPPLRWQRVLRGLELGARLPSLLAHYLAGLFVNNFFPSTIGGDVLRVTRLSAINGDRPGSFASV